MSSMERTSCSACLRSPRLQICDAQDDLRAAVSARLFGQAMGGWHGSTHGSSVWHHVHPPQRDIPDMAKSKIQDKAASAAAWRKTLAPPETDAVQQAVPGFVHHTHAGGGVLHEYAYLPLGVGQVKCACMPATACNGLQLRGSLQMPPKTTQSTSAVSPAPSLLISCPCLVRARADRASASCASCKLAETTETTETSHPTQSAPMACVGTLACRTRQGRRGAGTKAARPTAARARTAHRQRSSYARCLWAACSLKPAAAQRCPSIERQQLQSGQKFDKAGPRRPAVLGGGGGDQGADAQGARSRRRWPERYRRAPSTPGGPDACSGQD